MLISESYREQNRELHKDPVYGYTGKRWAEAVWELCQKAGTTDILDYGCGKRTLEAGLKFKIKNYDPAIPGFDSSPAPADIVACVDVLEHIEPECLDAVLDDLKRVTRKYGFFTIANRPAHKTLPDGRNAHLIQEGPGWWLPKICSRFRLVCMVEFGKDDNPMGFSMIVRAR